MFALELSSDAKRWMKEEPDSELVTTVQDWIENVLCDDQSGVHQMAEPVPMDRPGLPMGVNAVPDTDIAVTWFEAAPFRTIKVMRIERIGDVLSDLEGS